MENPSSSADGNIEIVSVGALYAGPWAKKYWSCSRGKDRYPYPVGYQALRTRSGKAYRMDVQEGPKGPLFVVSCTDGDACSGQTPDMAWDRYQKKRGPVVKNCREKRFSGKIDGVELFGFKNPLVQRLLRELVADANVVPLPRQMHPGDPTNTPKVDTNFSSLESQMCPDLLLYLGRKRATKKRSMKKRTKKVHEANQCVSLRQDLVHDKETCPPKQGNNIHDDELIGTSNVEINKDEPVGFTDNFNEVPAPKRVKFRRDLDLFIPDSFDCTQDGEGYFDGYIDEASRVKSHETSTICNNSMVPLEVSVEENNCSVAIAQICSEGQEESEPCDHISSGSSNPCSQRIILDSAGQDLTRSMMTVLLPRALPLLKKTYMRKRKKVHQLERNFNILSSASEVDKDTDDAIHRINNLNSAGTTATKMPVQRSDCCINEKENCFKIRMGMQAEVNGESCTGGPISEKPFAGQNCIRHINSVIPDSLDSDQLGQDFHAIKLSCFSSCEVGQVEDNYVAPKAVLNTGDATSKNRSMFVKYEETEKAKISVRDSPRYILPTVSAPLAQEFNDACSDEFKKTSQVSHISTNVNQKLQHCDANGIRDNASQHISGQMTRKANDCSSTLQCMQTRAITLASKKKELLEEQPPLVLSCSKSPRKIIPDGCYSLDVLPKSNSPGDPYNLSQIDAATTDISNRGAHNIFENECDSKPKKLLDSNFYVLHFNEEPNPASINVENIPIPPLSDNYDAPVSESLAFRNNNSNDISVVDAPSTISGAMKCNQLRSEDNILQGTTITCEINADNQLDCFNMSAGIPEGEPPLIDIVQYYPQKQVDKCSASVKEECTSVTDLLVSSAEKKKITDLVEPTAIENGHVYTSKTLDHEKTLLDQGSDFNSEVTFFLEKAPSMSTIADNAWKDLSTSQLFKETIPETSQCDNVRSNNAPPMTSIADSALKDFSTSQLLKETMPESSQHEGLKSNKKPKGSVEIIGCYVFPNPVLNMFLIAIEHSLQICVVSGVMERCERDILIYKVSPEGQTTKCPFLLGYTSLELSEPKIPFNIKPPMSSAFQFTPDGKFLILLNSIKVPYCREQSTNCTCSTCKSVCSPENGIQIVHVKFGYVSVINDFETFEKVYYVLVCEPNYLVAIEESGALHVWTMSTDWSSALEDFYLPSLGHGSHLIMELKRIPDCDSFIIGHDGNGIFGLWDIYKRILVATFSSTGHLIFQIHPIGLFNCRKNAFITEEQIKDISRTSSSLSLNNDFHLSVGGEDIGLWLLVSAASDTELHNDILFGKSISNPVGFWRLAMLVEHTFILGQMLDPRASAVEVASGRGLIGTCDGVCYMCELSTGDVLANLPYLNESDGGISSIAVERKLGALAVVGNMRHILLYSFNI